MELMSKEMKNLICTFDNDDFLDMLEDWDMEFPSGIIIKRSDITGVNIKRMLHLDRNTERSKETFLWVETDDMEFEYCIDQIKFIRKTRKKLTLRDMLGEDK